LVVAKHFCTYTYKAISYPKNWDPMLEGQTLKKVKLSPSSQEFKEVEQSFANSVSKISGARYSEVLEVYVCKL
jgi:hypothetical protein